MVDIRELRKRGVIRIPKNDTIIPTNQNGFVELGNNTKTSSQPSTTSSSNTEFFGFTDSPSTTNLPKNSFSTESDGYNKREVDQKITGLDNKIYKLENRVELLERKFNVNQPANTNTGIIGW